ncbi:MAG: GTP-binding protein [Candidatus Micrarchaeota archaeon]|nr:GTP-binding protein [Candidatus Micrarchaeota archaeon]
MGIEEKIRQLEEELARTQKNKATEYHIGLLKAKIARLKRELLTPRKSSVRTGGFEVKKSGDATVVFIGLPSVGKSTLLNALTGAKSKTAAYAFTTLNCVPGVLEHKGAKIQLLDLPGIIIGAAEGRGRGREVLAVARNADLVLILLDVFQPTVLPKIKEELAGIGVRLDEKPPKVSIVKKLRGGVEISSTVKLTKMDERMVVGILNEYGLHNASVVFHEDIGVDQLVDVLAGNRRYLPSLTVLNKVDMVSEDYLKSLPFDFVAVSAERGWGIEELKDAIFQRLRLIRIYTKPRMGEADLKEPMMLREGATVEDVCNRLHRDLAREFRYALVWGKSAKFEGQKVGLEHRLEDGDVVCIVKKQGRE